MSCSSPWPGTEYPEAERLKQIKGVGTLIALTYMLTLEDPQSFPQEPGCSLLRGPPAWEAELGAERAADAHQQRGRSVPASTSGAGCPPRLGPRGVDSDLRRWGTKLAEHGGKRGNKRAVVAVARKLAVLLCIGYG